MEMNSRKNSQSDIMKIKIQTFDNQFPLDILRESTVKELKEKISEKFDIPLDNQRLIFQGRLMLNEEKLSNYKIGDESVIHLVARSIEENNAQISNTDTSNNQQDNTDSRVEDVVPIIDVPFLRSRRQRRRRIPQFDVSECFESLHQNIATLQNLMNCKNVYDKNQIEQSKTIIPFDLGKSKYEVGQWVDVKDTIDQWLEAQIILVRNDQVYVHYNGWGTRWDEWIDFSSPRIAPLRTYTVQHPSSAFLTPYPHIPCDSNVEPQQRSIDAFYYMERTNYFMSEVAKMMEKMNKLRYIQHEGNKKQLQNNESEILFLTSQMIPVMDRCGRMMSDLSMQMSHLILNSNLSQKLMFGQNTVREDISLTSQHSNNTGLSNFNPDIESNLINPSGYDLNNSSSELPFMQRLNSSIGTNQNERVEPKYKINLQVPTILSPGDSSLLRGQSDSNIDIYVHTVIQPSRQRNNSTNVNIQSQINQMTLGGNSSNTNDQGIENIGVYNQRTPNTNLNSFTNTSDSQLNRTNEQNSTALFENIMGMMSNLNTSNMPNSNESTLNHTNTNPNVISSNIDENFESITEDVESKGSDTEEYEECYELNQRQKIDSQHQTSKK